MQKVILLFIYLCCALFSKAQTDGFSIEPISEKIKERIIGKSFPKEGARVSINDLRYLKVNHYDANGNIKHGEIIVNVAIAEDVISIFKELFSIKYPIESVKLVDDFNADDELSMRSNNSSGFLHRKVKGTRSFSKHSYGRAIDINPLYNPCFSIDKNSKTGYKVGTLQPATSSKYVSRKIKYPYTITEEVVRIFKMYAFRCGGDWITMKDYQHFEK